MSYVTEEFCRRCGRECDPYRNTRMKCRGCDGFLPVNAGPGTIIKSNAPLFEVARVTVEQPLPAMNGPPWRLKIQGPQHDSELFDKLNLTTGVIDAPAAVIFPSLDELRLALGVLIDRIYTGEDFLPSIGDSRLIEGFPGGRSGLVKSVLGRIDPLILSLASEPKHKRHISSERLKDIRLQQDEGSSYDTGYHIGVEDDRFISFWSYVGQTIDYRGRILRTHIPKILRAAYDSLLLYMVFKGNGHRSAVFTRLWSFSEVISPVNEPFRRLKCHEDAMLSRSLIPYTKLISLLAYQSSIFFSKLR